MPPHPAQPRHSPGTAPAQPRHSPGGTAPASQPPRHSPRITAPASQPPHHSPRVTAPRVTAPASQPPAPQPPASQPLWRSRQPPRRGAATGGAALGRRIGACRLQRLQLSGLAGPSRWDVALRALGRWAPRAAPPSVLPRVDALRCDASGLGRAGWVACARRNERRRRSPPVCGFACSAQNPHIQLVKARPRPPALPDINTHTHKHIKAHAHPRTHAHTRARTHTRTHTHQAAPARSQLGTGSARE